MARGKRELKPEIQSLKGMDAVKGDLYIWLQAFVLISVAVAGAGTAVFLAAPEALLRIFSQSEGVLAAGVTALRIIGTSFVPAGIGMMLTVYFQGAGKGGQSMLLTLVRQVFLLVPVAWALHFFGLTFVWLTFPITEVAVLVLCAVLWKRQDVGRTAVRVHA